MIRPRPLASLTPRSVPFPAEAGGRLCLAWLPAGAEVVPDAEHDAFNWWPADPADWLLAIGGTFAPFFFTPAAQAVWPGARILLVLGVSLQIAALSIELLRGLGELVALQAWRLRDRLQRRH